MALPEDYRAIREGAGIGATSPRGQIAVAGPDRATFLQGLLTNDIPALTPGTGCYAAWLTLQGRMLTDMHVLESEGLTILDLPRPQVEATLQRLDQFLFSENVQLQSLADSLASLWVHGPNAGAVVERALGVSGIGGWADYRHARFEVGVVARIDQLGVPGYGVFIDPGKQAEVVAALERSGAVPLSENAIAAARIEAGYPLFGVDMTDDTIPLEAGIENRAISFTKGCYVGQEVIIRVMHRGHGRVAKKLVGLKMEGPSATPGARIFGGDREIGFVTSAGESPRFGAIALGYVHRDFVAAGSAVAVDADRRTPAVVTSLPMS